MARDVESRFTDESRSMMMEEFSEGPKVVPSLQSEPFDVTNEGSGSPTAGEDFPSVLVEVADGA